MSMPGLVERSAETRILLELDCGGANPTEVELLCHTLTISVGTLSCPLAVPLASHPPATLEEPISPK